MTKPRIVLFDIGSTLWSSPPEDADALEYCYGRARDALGRAVADPPTVDTLIDAVEGYFAEWEEVWRQDAYQIDQAPTTDFVAEALRRLGLALAAEVVSEFTDLILETSIYTAKVEAHEPGMKEALAGLKERGLRLGCVSNAFMTAAGLHRIMEEKGLGPYLDLTVSSCEFGRRKPHPSIYEAAVSGLGAQATEAIFVGDRLDADIEGPAALGMRTVLTHQYRQEDPARAKVAPDAVIQHLSELVPYVDSLLEG
jgi:HAD superfamily hydrolase (TIGR01509 family)